MRPSVHLTAPSNWINDPNGLVRLDGTYHVYFQHHPHQPAWGRIEWGHVSSPDLVQWTRHPSALVPDDRPDAPDHDGCWSGCVIDIGGVPTAFYTGASGGDARHREVVCRAVSDRRAVRWTRDPARPVVDGDPPAGRHHQRDPFVFRLGERWIMLLGTGFTGEDGTTAGGAVVVFESSDTRVWHDRGILAHRPDGLTPLDSGPMWECPQLVPMGDRWVLIVSVQARGGPDPITVGSAWMVGDLIDAGPGGALRFEPTDETAIGWLDGGDLLYAVAVLPEAGRVLAWGWIRDPEPEVPDDDGPTVVGALSLPRVLTFEDGLVLSRPAPELDALAISPSVQVSSGRVAQDQAHHVASPAGASGARRIQVELDPLPETAVGVRLAGSPDADRGVIVGLDRDADGRLDLTLRDLDQGDHPGSPPRHVVAIPARPGPVRLDVWVDGPIIEAFAGGASLVTRFDRRAVPVASMDLIAIHGVATFSGLTVTALRPAVTIEPG